MPLTNAEFTFLEAYVYEVYTPGMTGPHTRAVRELGANQSDVAWLLTAWHRTALIEGKNPLGSAHPEQLPLPWSSKKEILARGQELREELEHQAKPAGRISA
jgi:hypothetical protein